MWYNKMDPGGVITLHEKKLVPGDYVHYDILYETETYQGPQRLNTYPRFHFRCKVVSRYKRPGEFNLEPTLIK